ncbi:MAG: hypothetical protein AB1439_10840 [candidate division FCPU426 bacterium]
MPRKTIVVFIMAFFTSFPLHAATSDQHGLEPVVVNAGGSTLSGNGRQLLDSIGESIINQTWGSSFSIQAGFFSDYFILPPTPTVTPTVTATSTPIRGFGGELLSESWVYAAPNPIRGFRANIVYHLAEPAEVEIKVFTVNNDLVISKHWDNVAAGENHWYWNTSGISNGVYLLLVKAKGQGRSTIIKKKIALVH